MKSAGAFAVRSSAPTTSVTLSGTAPTAVAAGATHWTEVLPRLEPLPSATTEAATCSAPKAHVPERDASAGGVERPEVRAERLTSAPPPSGPEAGAKAVTM